MNLPPDALATEAGRQRAVDFALVLTQGTPLAPGPYEQDLLAQFVRGELLIDDVSALLEGSDNGNTSLSPVECRHG